MPQQPARRSSSAPDDRQRLALIYREHRDFVSRLVRRLGAAPVDIDDLTQEVFLVAFRRLADWDQELCKVTTWLYGITVNVTRASARKRAREQARRLPESAALDVVAERVDEAELRAAAQIADQILARLPRKKREVFVLAERDGCTMPEIARLLGIKEATVGSRLHYARREVNEKLRRWLDDPAG